MKFHFNKPLVSLASSLLAVCLGLVLVFSIRFLPEPQSLPLFFVLTPSLLLLACLGYLTGAAAKNSRMATAGFLIGGGLILTVVIMFLFPTLCTPHGHGA